MTATGQAAGNVSPSLETIEREALLGWYRAASSARVRGFQWKMVEIGDALCSVSTSEPGILVNRVLGLGSSATPTHDQLARIRSLYLDHGIPHFFLHVMPNLVDADLEAMLAAAGYRRHRGWMKFTRDASRPPKSATTLTVRRIGPGEADAFADIVAPAFDMQPACRPALAAMCNDPHWQLFMSFDGDEPAGTGAVYLRGNTAYTDWGATRPSHRRRGSQGAILAARIRMARAAGCDTLVTMTGEAVPGDPQHSYGNILKKGFREAYLRENWVPHNGS